MFSTSSSVLTEIRASRSSLGSWYFTATLLVPESTNQSNRGFGESKVEIGNGVFLFPRDSIGFTGELGELGEEGGVGGGALDGDDSSIAADVAELVVVRARDDFAAEAAHEAHARVVRVVRVGARRRRHRVRRVGFDLRRVERRHFREGKRSRFVGDVTLETLLFWLVEFELLFFSTLKAGFVGFLVSYHFFFCST